MAKLDPFTERPLVEEDVANSAAVESAARLLRDRALAVEGSAFTPGRPIWTAYGAAELKRLFSDRPDNSGAIFFDKLRRQLDGGDDSVLQLMAELIYLNALPLSNVRGDTKRKSLATVLSWMQVPARVPTDLDAALDSGVFNGGVAFNTGRWQQLVFLIEFVREWTTLSQAGRQAALDDPWRFREVVRGVPEPNVPAQRLALQYLMFPRVLMPIVSTEHRARIAKAFRDEIAEPTGDIDRDLAAIVQALQRTNPGPVNFYRHPWSQRWMAPPPIRRAWLIRGSAVNGINVVPTWLTDGYVSLAAAHLRPVQPPIARDELLAAVEADYSHASYSARSDLVTEFDAFLNRMQDDDLVLTTSLGSVYLGTVSGPAEYVDSDDKRSNLRRTVDWSSANAPLDFGALPAPLPSRLSNQKTLVDLTADLELLESLLPTGEVVRPVSRDLRLADATDRLAAALLLPRDWLQETIELLGDRKQLIFYGPPGTGKTFLAQHLAWHLTERSNVSLVQFHPAYSYEDFFEGFRPSPTSEGSGISFTLTPGPFRRLVDAARANPTVPHMLIVDEINRANLAKVFGELYFLLEYRDQPVRLLYSGAGQDDFTLPANVFLIGTMNTADRSIALVDAAMRRRFAFVELHPSAPPIDGLLGRWLAQEGRPAEPALLLAALNSRIADRDFQIGPSYLMRPEVYRDGGLERTWRTALLPLLEEHHYGDGTDVSGRYGLAALRKALVPPTQVADEA
jgi:5-methylcytosine-specific restriction protein B